MGDESSSRAPLTTNFNKGSYLIQHIITPFLPHLLCTLCRMQVIDLDRNVRKPLRAWYAGEMQKFENQQRAPYTRFECIDFVLSRSVRVVDSAVHCCPNPSQEKHLSSDSPLLVLHCHQEQMAPRRYGGSWVRHARDQVSARHEE